MDGDPAGIFYLDVSNILLYFWLLHQRYSMPVGLVDQADILPLWLRFLDGHYLFSDHALYSLQMGKLEYISLLVTYDRSKVSFVLGATVEFIFQIYSVDVYVMELLELGCILLGILYD